MTGAVDIVARRTGPVPAVSVITPVFNPGADFGVTGQALASQTLSLIHI